MIVHAIYGGAALLAAGIAWAAVRLAKDRPEREYGRHAANATSAQRADLHYADTIARKEVAGRPPWIGPMVGDIQLDAPHPASGDAEARIRADLAAHVKAEPLPPLPAIDGCEEPHCCEPPRPVEAVELPPFPVGDPATPLAAPVGDLAATALPDLVIRPDAAAEPEAPELVLDGDGRGTYWPQAAQTMTLRPAFIPAWNPAAASTVTDMPAVTSAGRLSDLVYAQLDGQTPADYVNNLFGESQ